MLEEGLRLLDHLRIKGIRHRFYLLLNIHQVKELSVPKTWFSMEIDILLVASLEKELTKLKTINLSPNTVAKANLPDHPSTNWKAWKVLQT